jgi:hypothetical protein
MASSPRAYWRLGEASGNPQDISGNNNHVNAITGSPTYAQTGAIAGDTNTSITLSSTQYLSVPHASSIDLGDGPWSIEFWYRRDTDSGSSASIIAKGNTALTDGIIINVRAAAPDIMVLDKFGMSGYITAATGDASADGLWHHWVCTRSGSGAGNTLWYRDGVEGHADNTPAATIGTTDLPLDIGMESGQTTLGAYGGLDEIALYASVLTAAQVKRHYLAGKSAYLASVFVDDPSVHYRLAEPSGTTAAETTDATYNGTYVNTPTLGATGALDGDTDTAVTFAPASLEYVTVPDGTKVDVGDGPVSIEAWIKRADTSTTNYHAIVSKGRVGSGDASYVGQVMATTGKLGFGKAGNNDIVISSAAITDTNWHHVVFTRFTTGVQASRVNKIYLDGVDVTDTGTEATVVNLVDNSLPMLIGVDDWTDSSGKVNYFGGTLDEVAVYKTALPAARVLAHYVRRSKYAAQVIADSPVAYWRLGEASGNYIDSVGSEHLTPGGTAATRNITGAIAGDINGAISLNGGYGTSSSALNPWGSDFTVEAWAYFSATGYRAFASTYATTEGFRLGHSFDSWAFWCTENGGAASITDADTAVLDAWYHVAVTRVGSLFTLYVNGVSRGTSSGAYVTPTAGGFRLGVAGNDWLYGVDELAVYSTALTAAQVLNHYNLGKPTTGNVVRAIADSLASLADSLARAAAAKVRANADSISSLSDVIAAIKVFPRVAADSIASVADSLVRSAAAKTRTASDSVGSLTDSLVRRLTALRTNADSVGSLTDSLVKSAATRVRVAADSVGSLTDSLVKAAATRVRAAADSVSSLTDSVVGIKVQVRAVADSIATATDSLARAAATRVRTAADSVSSLSDTLARVTALFRTNADSIASLTDSIFREVILGLIVRAVSDSYSAISDSVSRTILRVRTASDSVGSISDSIVALKVQLRLISDSLASLSDSVARVLSARRTPADSIGSLTDSILRNSALSRTVSDTVGAISDAIDWLKLLLRSLSDSVPTMTDSLTREAAVYARTPADMIAAISDSILVEQTTLTGVTRNQYGTPIPNCVVDLFRSVDNVFIATTTSDGLGVYSFDVTPGVEYFCVAYSITGQVYGVTARDLVGS